MEWNWHDGPATGERIARACQNFMALILCAGLDPALMQTRLMILERAGNTAIGVRSESEFIAACESYNFEVIVLSQTLSAEFKLRLSAFARLLRPEAKVLELYSAHLGPAVSGADESAQVPLESPGDLPSRIELLLSNKTKTAAANVADAAGV